MRTLLIIFILLPALAQAQHFQKLGSGLNNKEFFHQQTINYNVLTSDDKGNVYGVLYDVVSSGFQIGTEYTQIRLRIFNGISWLNTHPIRLYSRYSVDAPRVLDIKFFDGCVYIAGSFDSSSNDLGAGILRWKNSQWESCNANLLQTYQDYFEVNKIHIYSDGLLVTGNFDSVPGERVNGLLKYEAGAWSSIGNVGKKGFNNLSGTSNVFFHGDDSLYVYNKNKIKPDSIEIGGETFKKMGVFRAGKFVSLAPPDDYIAAICMYQNEPVVVSASQLLYINSIQFRSQGQWIRKPFSDNDSFYTTNYLGCHKKSGDLYLYFQKPGTGIKVYRYGGSDVRLISEFRVSDNYLSLEFNAINESAIISGNFDHVSMKGNLVDSFNKVCVVSYFPLTNVQFKCFNDRNNNGIRDAGEENLRDMRILEHNSGQGLFSDGNGNLVFGFSTLSSLKFSGQSSDGYSSSKAIDINASADSLYIYDFPFVSSKTNDAAMFVSSSTANRVKLGFESKYFIEISNSSDNDKTLQIWVRHHEKIRGLKFSKFTPDNTGKDYFTFSVLIPGHSRIIREFSCVYSVDSFQLNNRVKVSASFTDSDDEVNNNTDTIDQTTVSAYDPNIKIPNPSSVNSKKDYIDYYIYFENLGNDTATNVTVVDTFSSKLNYTSFKIIQSSHDYTLGFGFLSIIFHFNNINLPPTKHNPESSRGYIALRTYMDEAVDIGDTIYNSAAIFFDYQQPVITNKSEVVFKKKSSITDILSHLFSLYPNPGNGNFRLNSEEIEGVAVTDIGGKTILTLEKNERGEFCSNDQLSPGVYFVSFTYRGALIQKKLIVIN